jgi:Methyl-accepting chemotaxis protein
MRNKSVSSKIVLAFGVLILLALMVSTTGLIGMYLMHNADLDMYDSNVVAMDLSSNIQNNFANQHMHLRNLIISPYGSAPYKDSLAYLETTENEMVELLSKYQRTIITEQDQMLFDIIRFDYEGSFSSVKKTVIEQSKKAEPDETYFAELVKMNESVKKIASNLSECFRMNFELTGEAMARNTQRFNNMLFAQACVMVLIIIVGILIALYMNNRIGKPLGLIAKAADQIATGDLNVSLSGTNSKDEVGQLSAAFEKMVLSIKTQAEALTNVAKGDLTVKLSKNSENDVVTESLMSMTDSLNNIIGEFSMVAGQVATNADNVTKGSQAMAQGVSEQASAIEELSSSIYEISLNTRENAKMADKAAELYKEVNLRALESSDLMRDMLRSVEEITEASANVAKIIKMINDIAFQTNILSLNAAVEAANAGQHGRGFAVVAGEVRNLAMKSAKAATDTDALIENTLQKAKQGAAMAEKTHAALEVITKDIMKGSQMIEDIAKATGEQSLGIEQVNIGIEQVAQVVNINSATAEESAMAAEEMASMATAMESLIARFKLTDGMAAGQERMARDSQRSDVKPVILLDDSDEDSKY